MQRNELFGSSVSHTVSRRRQKASHFELAARRRRAAGLLIAASAAVASSHTAKATTYYWDNNGTTAGFGTAGGTWGSSADWNTSSAGTGTSTAYTSTTSDTLNFGVAGTTLAAGTITVSGTQNIGGLTYAAGDGAIALSGGTINFGAAGTIQVNSANALTIYSVISGAGTSLTISGTGGAGTGTLVLAGNNTYTGSTIINSGGRLQVNTTTALPSGTAVTVNSGGQLLFTPAGTFGQNITINGNGWSDIYNTVDGALRVSTAEKLTGTITLGSNSSIDEIINTGITTFTGQITGGYGLSFTGIFSGAAATETFVLANTGTADNYTGNTTIVNTYGYNAGSSGPNVVTLELGASNQLPSGSSAGELVWTNVNTGNINRQEVFQLNGFNQTLNGISASTSYPSSNLIENTLGTGTSVLTITGGNSINSTFGGTIADGGAGSGKYLQLNLTGGTLVLEGTNTYVGNTIVSGGVLSLASSGAYNGNLQGSSVTVTGTGSFLEGSSNFISGSGVTFTQNSSGSSSFTGSNSFTGATAINAGLLALTGSGQINGSSGITVNGSGATFLQKSSVAVSPAVTLTQGTVTGSGTINTVNVGAGTGGIISNNNGVAGASLTIGTLSFAGAATVNTYSSSTAAPIIVSSSLATNAAGVVTIDPSAVSWTSNATYNLIAYGGGSVGGAGDTQFSVGTIAGLTARQSASMLIDTGSDLQITISGTFPYWKSQTLGGAGNWDTTEANDWEASDGVNDQGATTFLAGDTVLFDDRGSSTGTGTVNVNIDAANVNPTTTTFNNTNTNYVISSSTGNGITSGLVTIEGGGSVTMSASTSNSYDGTTTVINGSLLNVSTTYGLGDGSANNTLILSSGTLQAGGSFTSPSTRGISLPGAGTIDTNGNTVSIAGVISGNGALTKVGAGTLTLTGSESYTGATTVSAGTLVIGGSGTIVSSVVTNVLSGATLTLTGSVESLASGYTSGATYNIAGTLNQNTSTAWSLPLAGGGAVNLSSGTLAGTYVGTTGAYLANAGALSIINATGNSTITAEIGGNQNMELNTPGASDTLTFSGQLGASAGQWSSFNASSNGANGYIYKSGSGTVVLTNNSNSFACNLLISGGTLQVGNGSTGLANSAYKFIVASGGTLAYDQANNTSASAPVVVSAGALLNAIQSGTTTFTGAISGGGNVVQSGAGTSVLTATSSYSGATTISQGTLQIGNGTTGTDNSTSGFTVNSGTNLVFKQAGTSSVLPTISDGGTVYAAQASGTTTFSNSITDNGGGGGFVQSGAGTSILTSNSNAYAGPTIVSAGTLQIGNGSSGLNAGTSAYTVKSGANLTFDQVGGTSVSQSITDNGTVAASHASGVVTFGNISGTGGFTQSGAGESDLFGTNSYNGTTLINNGTVRSTNFTGPVTINSGGTLAVGTTGSNAILTSSAGHTWKSGGQYVWKISDAGTGFVQPGSGGSGALGGGSDTEGTNWDLINITSGILNLSSITTSNPFVITPTGMINSSSYFGGYSWVIAQVAGNNSITLPTATNPTTGQPYAVGDDLTSGGTGGAFAINTSALTDTANLHPLTPSDFSLEAENIGGNEDLVLDYTGTPEPGTVMLVLGGVAPMLMGRRRRRQQSKK